MFALLIFDLRNPPVCESGADPERGLTDEELRSFSVDGLTDNDVYVIPLCNTFPMGFGWSSYAAQSTMLAACRRIGYGDDHFLTGERVLPASQDVRVAIATDDINVFERLSPGEVGSSGPPPLSALDDDWIAHGIVGHDDKAADRQRNARVLGVDLREGWRLQARGDKVLRIIEAVCDFANLQQCSPLDVSTLVGQLQWQALLNRPLFSAFDKVYEFSHRQPDKVARALDTEVLSELLLIAALCPFWSCDLSRPWWPHIVATDASPTYGFGMCVAKCAPSLTRATAAAAADPECIVRMRREEGDPAEVARVGKEFRLPLALGDFIDVFSLRADTVVHSGALEMQAVKLALLRVTRQRRHHGHRGVVLVDARAVGFTLQKGRTSAKTLWRGCLGVAAICLATDLKLAFPYVPSESNAADFPSRGLVRRRTRRRKPQKLAKSKFEEARSAERRALRHLRACGWSG